MLRKTLLVIVACLFLCTSTTQAAFIGYQLSRQPIQNFTLTTQNGSEYNFDRDSNDIIVLSFIFTRCPDVCPTITQSMKSVETLLTDEEKNHITFVSITTDPLHDGPEELETYSQIHQASWPHLTGTYEQLLPIWSTFGIVVENVYEQNQEEEFKEELRSQSLLIESDNGTFIPLMLSFEGRTWTQIFARQLGIDIETSQNEDGQMMTSINNIESNASWSWEVLYWNEKFDSWLVAEDGISSIDVLDISHFAWAPSNANTSNLNSPDPQNVASMTVMYENQTTMMTGISSWNGFAASASAFTHNQYDADIVFSSWGNYLSSIDKKPSENETWWWQLSTWNQTNSVWEESQVGMDDVNATTKIAWHPSTTNLSDIPSPYSFGDDEQACGGHGWLMGENQSLHCMCDAGYSWPDSTMLLCVEDATKNYTVGHSSATYLLDQERVPRIMWAGEHWIPEDFVKDVRELMEKENTLGVGEGPGLPSASLTQTLLVLVLGLMFWSYQLEKPRESRKK